MRLESEVGEPATVRKVEPLRGSMRGSITVTGALKRWLRQAVV